MDLSQYDIPNDVLRASDPIAILVQVHLHLEAFIIALVRYRLAKPQAIDLDRLTFPVKLSLAVALDAIPELAEPALLTINRLRNRVAHNLSAALTAEDVAALRKQLAFITTAEKADHDSQLPPAAHIAYLATRLQAWLNGFFESTVHHGLLTDVAAIQKRAEERYPYPITKNDESSG